jgi:hypothetical protein
MKRLKDRKPALNQYSLDQPTAIRRSRAEIAQLLAEKRISLDSREFDWAEIYNDDFPEPEAVA